MRAVPRLCELYPGICLTTEEKAWKTLSQGSRRVLVYILPKRTLQNPYIHTHTLQNPHIHTHTLQNPHIHRPTYYKTHTHTHIIKQFKTTTVQVKTSTVQDVPKWNSHNIIKYPQYKVNGTFIHKNFTAMHFISLYPQELHRNALHFTNPFTSLLTSLH